MNAADMRMLSPAHFEFRLGDIHGPGGIDRSDFPNWFYVAAVPMAFSSEYRPSPYDRDQNTRVHTSTSVAVMWARKWRPWGTLEKYDPWFASTNCAVCGKGHTYKQGQEVAFWRDHPDVWAHLACGEKADQQAAPPPTRGGRE